MTNLIKQVAAGDTSALEKLYIYYKPIVFKVALSILNDRFLAEDVMQETFLKIQLNASSFRYGNNVKSWIMTIARNTAIDALKKRQTELPEASVCDKSDTNIDLICQDKDEKYLQLIRPLSDLDKQIISLHLIGELRHREISRILNMSTAAVKKRYERALKKIAKQMEENI